MPNSRYDPSDSRYWEEPESNEDLDENYYFADDPYDDDDNDDSDDTKEEESLNLGTCCACGQANHPRNIIALSFRNPYGRGCGWGCFQCGLPMEGAIAALCDDCLARNAQPTEFIKDEARQHAPIAELTEPFEHDLTYHPELELA